jgi:hypothetical protein
MKAKISAPVLSAVLVGGLHFASAQTVNPRLQSESAPTAAPVPASPAATGAVRVGITLPINQMESSDLASSESLRALMIRYLQGPGVDVVPIEAMLPAQAEAEARSKRCDYILQVTASQKRAGGGMSLLRGASAMSGVIPAVGMAGGLTGAVASSAANAAINGAVSLSSGVKAKSEVSLEYRLSQVGSTSAVASNVVRLKAKQDGQDVFTPLVTEADTEVLAKVVRKE